MLLVGSLLLASAVQAQDLRLDSLAALELHGVDGQVVAYRGRRAVRLVENRNASTIAVLKGVTFKDGVIEAEVAGVPRAGANQGARGFIGIAFRVQNPETYEAFYIRPTNGRADDQLRRNHATQYISEPEWPWHRLRKEDPGVYESYADLQPGVWTKMKIVVSGTKAQLYVNGAEQPCLIVNDLKHGEGSGAVALWIGSGTEAYFSNISLRSSLPASAPR